MTLPRPNNLQAKRMLQSQLNRLALSPTRTCQSLHSCIFCGQNITLGQKYRDRGYACRAHVDCVAGMSSILRCTCGLQMKSKDESLHGFHHPECPEFDGHN